jgi:adenylate cyclase
MMNVFCDPASAMEDLVAGSALALRQSASPAADMAAGAEAAYVPLSLVEKLTAAEQAGGAPRLTFSAAVLMVDIVNSTGIADQLDATGPRGAEDFSGALGVYFSGAVDTIERHGGEIARIVGDAIMAVWPAGERPDRAVAAAAAAALALGDKPSAGDGPELASRTMLDFGRVEATALGQPGERRFVMLSGEPMRTLASGRLRGGAGEVRIAPAAVAVAGNRLTVETDSRGGLRVTGADADPAVQARSAPAMLSPGAGDFVPALVRSRVAAGLAGWLAEFRSLTAVYVGLGDIADTRLDAAFATVQAAAQRVDAAIWDVLNDDKGVIFLVIFGLPPFATENNAVRGIDLARRIHADLAAIGLVAATGITTGRAFCGDVGGATRREYVSLGPVMNYGARLMQAASDGVYCDAATAAAAGSLFQLGPPEEIVAKGRRHPLTVHRLLGYDAPAVVRTPSGEAIDLVGRAAVRASIGDSLSALAGGRALPLIVEGEAGAGKSCLLDLAAERADARGYRVAAVSALPTEQRTPLFLFRQLVPLLAGEGAAIDRDETLRRLQAVLGDEEPESRLALFEDVLGAGNDRSPAAGLAGAARRGALERLVVRLFARLAETRPIVVLIDDLHWADLASLHLLERIVREAPSVLLIGASRPIDGQDGSEALGLLAAQTERLPLDRLDSAATAAIAARRIGVEKLPARLADYIHAQSEGLPLYAEQLALSLKERGLVTVRNGRCEVQPGLSGGEGPPSLRNLIVSRVDRLDAVAQLTAKCASVIGRNFTDAMAAAIHPMGLPADRLAASIDALVSAGFVDRIAPGSYTFHHTLVQDTIYATLSFAQREPLHRAIAARLEQQDATAPYLADLARHWEGARHTEKAIRYRTELAQAALRAYAINDALDQAQHIERIASGLGGGLSPDTRLALERIRADANQELARFDAAGAHFRACARLAGVSVPEARPAMLASLVGHAGRHLLRRLTGRLPASDGARRERDRLAAHIHVRLAEHSYFAGRPLGILHGTLASLNHAERARSATEMTVGNAGLAIGFGNSGLFGLARSYAARAVAIATAEGGKHELGLAHLCAMVGLLGGGDWDEIIGHARSGARLFGELGDEFRRQNCLGGGAHAQICCGNIAEARAMFAEIAADPSDIEALSVRSWAVSGLAIADMIDGAPLAPMRERLEALLEDPLSPGDLQLCQGPLAAMQWRDGDLDLAAETLRAMIVSVKEAPPSQGTACISVGLAAETGVALMAAGKLTRAEAVTLCRVADRLARTKPIAKPRATMARGRLALASGAPGKAAALFRNAMAMAQRLGIPVDAHWCERALAALAEGRETVPDMLA